MFNKPAMFPKTAEPAGARPLRPGMGASVSAAAPGSSSAAGSPPMTPTREPAEEKVEERLEQGASPVAEEDNASGGSRLIVGPDVKLKGAEILDCDTLVVEGRVEATMDSRVIRIAEKGAYAGTVGIDVAEIHGRFDGELTARKQLIIHATGRVSGKIRYGKIFIEEGGEISGDVQSLAASSSASSSPVRRPTELRPESDNNLTESKPLAALAG
ncbi:polymer-forming cytoskeletal protein [Azoarcus sp. TTM-91]|uniref:bactofilin family protein n=1 Tax=Azoarcus sp. TTM-91 TaxID=2691581 RepID=UPI002006EF16|nr:polymer-forming cytoskeletal protein [Azoarcus sp. TTM-91]